MSEDRDEPPLLPAGKRGQGEHLHRAGEPAAVILAGDILRWVIPKVAKLPRNLRYGLGARIEAALTDVLEELVAAQYARGPVRKESLARANRRVQVGRHLARLAVEMGVLSPRKGLYLAGLILDLGRQVGGWHKASDATGRSSRGSATPDT